MDHWDLRLIGVTSHPKYEEFEDNLEMRLFGKMQDGRSVAVKYRGFEPYFYIVEPSDDVVKILEADAKRIRRTEEVELLYGGEMRRCRRVVATHPGLVPSIRRDLMDSVPAVLAADIPFHFRFVYDLGIGACVRVFGNESPDEAFATDIVVEAERFEEIPPFRPDLKILSFDIETSLKESKIFTICCVAKEGDKISTKRFFGDEKRIISDFSSYIIEIDPDVITGYNIDGFDIPQVEQRAKDLGLGPLIWGRFPTEIDQYNRFWRAQGRVIIDAWWAVKRVLKPKQETLNAVAKQLLDEEKHDVDPKKMDEEWEADSERVMEYCVQDAALALRILEKIAILNRSMDLAAVSKLPLDDVVNGSTSQLVDSILIREADRQRVAVPMTSRSSSDSKPIEGGYVHEMEPGLYHWVLTLDFRSMYPSMIIANNICFTTLSPEGSIVSPTGARFLSKEKREGLLPGILISLMEERAAIKRAMNDAEMPDEKDYYNGLQEAVKILMNSFYGVLASSFYRFTDPKIGASITAFSREATKELIRKLEGEDLKVIYSDTDSVFFLSPHEDLDATIRLGKDTAERFSKGGMVLEFEKVMEPFFSHGKKKRYVGRMIWPREELIVRGYEMRRTDSFDLQSETLQEVFERILADDMNGAVAYTRGVIDDLLAGKVDPAKLVISRSVKDESQYKASDRMVNVRVARMLRDMGYEVMPGMKVSWIVTNGKASPNEVEPWIEGREFVAKPDSNYYATRIAATVSRVTDTFGWDSKSLLTGAQQKTLTSHSFRNTRGPESSRVTARPKRTDSKLSLDDFM
ncbi:MAG: ribonuclease H-like domain-containing protein [Methanobacteriota archaeon]|nr:MAG: ribonuclease H-like domain-containing protein [Euryarchaeota archaeon]